MTHQISFLEQVGRSFDRAAVLTDHDPILLRQIKVCNSVYHISFPLIRDDGTLEVIQGWGGRAHNFSLSYQNDIPTKSFLVLSNTSFLELSMSAISKLHSRHSNARKSDYRCHL